MTRRRHDHNALWLEEVKPHSIGYKVWGHNYNGRHNCNATIDTCNTCKTERREGMFQPPTPKLVDQVSALGFELFSDVNFSFVPKNFYSWRSREWKRLNHFLSIIWRHCNAHPRYICIFRRVSAKDCGTSPLFSCSMKSIVSRGDSSTNYDEKLGASIISSWNFDF